MDFKRNRHAVYKLQYHLVVVTKYRKKCINKEMLERLKEIAHNLFERWGCEVIEINGESDHVHIMFEAHPQIELSKAINNFKTVSSRYIREKFEEHLMPYYWKPYFWNRSYCIISARGATVEIIKQYIEEQSQPEV